MSFRFKRLFVEYQSTLPYTLLTDSQQDITNSEIYCMDGRNVVVPVIEIQATVCFISSSLSSSFEFITFTSSSCSHTLPADLFGVMDHFT